MREGLADSLSPRVAPLKHSFPRLFRNVEGTQQDNQDFFPVALTREIQRKICEKEKKTAENTEREEGRKREGGRERGRARERERVHSIPKELQGKHKTPLIYMCIQRMWGEEMVGSGSLDEQGQIPWKHSNKNLFFLLFSLSRPEWEILRKSGLLVEELRDSFIDILKERFIKCCQRSW